MIAWILVALNVILLPKLGKAAFLVWPAALALYIISTIISWTVVLLFFGAWIVIAVAIALNEYANKA